MTLAIITCAVFPDRAAAERKLWIFLASCRKFNVTPLLYGVGDPWSIYRDIKLTKQLAFLKSEAMREYSHALYTDSWDGFLLAPQETIEWKYKMLGSPDILTSASHQLANVSEEDKRYPGVFAPTPKFRYPHVGGWIGKKDAMIAAFEQMEAADGHTSDDCFDWFDGVRDGWFRPTVDSNCQIFQVTEEDCVVRENDGTGEQHLLNTHTGTLPCVLHLPGGWTSQEWGKDDRMKPWAERLGIL